MTPSTALPPALAATLLTIVDVDTDMIIPKRYSEDDQAHRSGAPALSPKCVIRTTARTMPISRRTSRLTAKPKSLSRATISVAARSASNMRLGALLDFGIRSRDLHELWRYSLRQLLQERHSSNHGVAIRSRQADGRCAARRACNDDNRPARSGNCAGRPDGGVGVI